VLCDKKKTEKLTKLCYAPHHYITQGAMSNCS